MVDVWLPYGGTEVCVRVPTENLQDIIEANEVAGAESPEEEIKKALENPIDAKSLAETVKPGDRVVLALSIHDPMIARLAVSSILEEIAKGGLKAEDLTVLFTYEIFDPSATALPAQLINELSPLGVNVVSHDPSAESVYVGESASGVKVYLNKIFAESKVKIVAGTVRPDPYTIYEWSGCGVALGLSNLETVKQIFMPTLNLDAASDLMHKNILEVSRIVGADFSVNIVVNREGKIVRSVAGDLEKSFFEASKIADEIYKFPVEKKADVVFVSSGGSPFDSSFFKACRCIENALKIIRRKGVTVLVAECPKGHGNPEFYEAVSRFKNDLNSLGKSLRKSFRVGGLVAYRLLRAFRKADIAMVSTIPDYYASEIPGLKVFRTANEALNYALEARGRRSKISVLPNGNLIIPTVEA